MSLDGRDINDHLGIFKKEKSVRSTVSCDIFLL